MQKKDNLKILTIPNPLSVYWAVVYSNHQLDMFACQQRTQHPYISQIIININIISLKITKVTLLALISATKATTNCRRLC